MDPSAVALPLPQVAYLIGTIMAIAVGGGATHAWHRRRNGNDHAAATTDNAREEVLRQGLHVARHEETMRVLGDVATTAENAARASERAAEAAARAATATERMATSLERHLERCER